MTIGELRQALARKLGLPSAEIEMIVAHVGGRERAWVRAHEDAPIDAAPVRQIRALCERRAAGEPLAYVLGSAGFYGREFVVNSHVLVPRPETEHLVDEALAHLRGLASAHVVDIGTGSGAIACTIAAELPHASVDAIDISPDALVVAAENARRLGVSERVHFRLGDLAGPVAAQRYDAVVANLPYVPTAEIAAAPDPVSFEPRLALDGGPDGLDLYRRLLAEPPGLVMQGGILLLEAAPPTIKGLAALARAAFPTAEIRVGDDYGGRGRYVRVHLERAKRGGSI